MTLKKGDILHDFNGNVLDPNTTDLYEIIDEPQYYVGPYPNNEGTISEDAWITLRVRKIAD